MEGFIIGNALGLLGLLIALVKFSFKVGAYKEQVDELKRDQQHLYDKIDKLITKSSAAEERFINLLDKMASGLVTKEELSALLKHYDATIRRSETDREHLWEKIDELLRTKQDKQDCQLRPH